jgi:hypothetical protein
MLTGNIRAVQSLLGHNSIGTTEIYPHLSDKHLHGVVSYLPSPDLGTFLDTPVVLLERGIVQVVEKKLVGGRGFEPLTSTECRI